jgi:KDO2-lipid IV(A) lauroyltransferase
MLQQVANIFEQAIREHTQDWHMLQVLFSADLDPARTAARPSARAR